MELIVGTDSTWSLRAWICLQLVNIEVSEHIIDLAGTDYKTEILKYSPSGLVPALIPILVSEPFVIHDSLAITEYLNEQTNGALYPKNVTERALARSLCSEMHAGFTHLRKQLPFTLKSIANKVEISRDLENELTRIETIFELAEVPYMFESAGAVDAFYSILAFRLKSYGITFEGKAGEYQRSLLNWSLLNKAITKAEQWMVAQAKIPSDGEL